MLLINRLGIVIAVLICTAKFSDESFLRDILNSGKDFFTKNRYQSASDRIISHNHDEQSADKDYEKPTHREPDYDGYESNHKNNENFHADSPTSLVHPHKKPSKHEHEYNHKYVVYTHTKYPSLNLYSVLGGLSFASLLATTLIVLLRRNGSLFRTFDDNDLLSRSLIHGHHGYFENNNPYNLFKLIDHSKKHWRKKSQ